MSVGFNGQNIKNATFNGQKCKKITFNGTTVFTSTPDIIYLYNKGSVANYPLVFTGGNNSSTAYAGNGARNEGTNVYLGAFADGPYHSAGYMCYTRNKIDVTEYKKLVRNPTENWCVFGLCKTIPKWSDLYDFTKKYAAYGSNNQKEINISNFTGEYYIMCHVFVSSDSSGSYAAGLARFNQLYLSV